MTLHDIRLQLRGPIAESPFAGSNWQAKFEYCQRQGDLFMKWYHDTENTLFLKQAKVWFEKCQDAVKGRI